LRRRRNPCGVSMCARDSAAKSVSVDRSQKDGAGRHGRPGLPWQIATEGPRTKLPRERLAPPRDVATDELQNGQGSPFAFPSIPGTNNPLGFLKGPGKRDQSREPAEASIRIPAGFTTHGKSFVVQILFIIQVTQNESVNRAWQRRFKLRALASRSVRPSHPRARCQRTATVCC
jgi:hypothetical protein